MSMVSDAIGMIVISAMDILNDLVEEQKALKQDVEDGDIDDMVYDVVQRMHIRLGQTVWVVRLLTTGEEWHSVVCYHPEAALSVMATYGITEVVSGNIKMSEFCRYVSATDPSQTASVHRKEVVGR